MEPQDALVGVIRSYASTLVPADLVEPVTRATCMAIARVMADPNFTSQLKLVSDLRQENAWLRNNLAIAQETLRTIRTQSPTTKKASPRKSSGRKTPPKSAATAFRQGIRDVRR